MKDDAEQPDPLQDSKRKFFLAVDSINEDLEAIASPLAEKTKGTSALFFAGAKISN